MNKIIITMFLLIGANNVFANGFYDLEKECPSIIYNKFILKPYLVSNDNVKKCFKVAYTNKGNFSEKLLKEYKIDVSTNMEFIKFIIR